MGLTVYGGGGDFVTKTELNEHTNNSDIHVTADEKALFSEKEIFMAVYGTTTSAEIEAAYQAGKAIFCKAPNLIKALFIPLKERTLGSNPSYKFFGIYDKNRLVEFVLDPASIEGPETWSYSVIKFELVPAVTAHDNGKILQVVNGVWTAVTPS